jgi:ATP diphosphatase
MAVMARLRDPVSGCEWDTAQTFATIAPYTIEEAYEVADAIQRGDLDDLKDELGDLALQIVFTPRWRPKPGTSRSIRYWTAFATRWSVATAHLRR